MRTGQMKDIKIPIMVSIGDTFISLEQLNSLGEGSIIELGSIAGEPVDLIAAGEKIAKGEVVIIDENFGLRVTRVFQNKE